MWSGCSGINAELFAWRELKEPIKRIIGADASLMLYYTYGQDPKSMAFVEANHKPQHASTCMHQTSFETGMFWCRLNG